MIRPARPEDADAILALTDATGLFKPHELEEIREVLTAHFAGDLGPDHCWFTDDDGDGPAAVAYYAPEPFADRVWNLYMLMVHPDRQGGGRGARLVEHAERDAAARGGRVLLIDTSGTERYERTRAFYRRCGYDEEARIREYYGPGDDKVVYWKALAA